MIDRSKDLISILGKDPLFSPIQGHVESTAAGSASEDSSSKLESDARASAEAESGSGRSDRPSTPLKRKAAMLPVSEAARRLLSAEDPKHVSPQLESMLDLAWARERDAYLARLRPRVDVGGEPGSVDSSEESDISIGAPRPKEKTRTLLRRAAQRLRRLLEVDKKSSLSEFMSFLETAAVSPKTAKNYQNA